MPGNAALFPIKAGKSLLYAYAKKAVPAEGKMKSATFLARCAKPRDSITKSGCSA